jgi:hypothetical protein
MTAYLILDRLRFRPLRYACISVLLTLAMLSAVQGWRDAWLEGSFRRASGIALTRDARAGVSGLELHARYHEAFARWDSTLSMAPTLDLFRARNLGPYDESKAPWMGQFEEPLSRELQWRTVEDLAANPPGAPGQARVKPAGKAFVLRVDDEEGWFLLTLLSTRGTRPWLLEMDLWSPAATQTRFSAGEGNLQVVDVEEGVNTLRFMIRPEGPVSIRSRFSPGRVPGNYRLEGTRRYELP